MNRAVNLEEKKAPGQHLEGVEENWIEQCENRFFSKIFTGLNQERTKAIRELATPVKYREGDLIFQEGDLADGIYFICSGLAVYGKQWNSDSERKRVFRLLGSGDVLGQETLFEKNPGSRFGYARAVENTELLFLEKTNTLDLLEDQPRLFRDFCRDMSEQIQVLEKKLLREGFLTTDRCLADLLTKIVAKQGDGEDRRSSKGCVGLRRKTLAEILGVSKGSITKSLNKLERKGLVSLQGEKICVTSGEGLIEFVDN